MNSLESPDVRELQVHREPPKRDVPFVPTDEAVVNAMLELARVTSSDVVYDLGCGDGRIVIEAARRGATAVGVDIDLQRIRESLENATRANVRDRVTFTRASFFDVDLRDATVVTTYLLPGVNVRLRPKLLWELRPGARIVSNNFEMGDWPPDATFPIFHRSVMLWIVPAWVGGEWKCVMADDARTHVRLRLARRYQRVTGTLRAGRQEVAISRGRLVGDQLSFVVSHPKLPGKITKFAARVIGAQMRGNCVEDCYADVPDVRSISFCAMRA